MKLGISVRLMGEAANRETLVACARLAEDAGIDDLWVPDHIAIPPDDAEGSNGRYLDALTSLAFLAAATERIGLGTGVLVLPYRGALSIAKQVATVQELSGGRMRLGIGVGWMKPEFQALGVPRTRRGAITDATLDLIHRCFDADDDVVTENDQPFLFRPKPERPPIFVGGAGAHALERTVRYGDGWMPMSADPAKLEPAIAELRVRAERAGRAAPEVVAFGGLPGGDPARGAELLAALAGIGVTRFATGARYGTDTAPFEAAVENLAAARSAL